MFACPGKSQIARNKEAQRILIMFNFERTRDYHRIYIVSYFEKIQFCVRFLNQSDVIDTVFFWNGNRIARFFFKNITSEHVKESASVIALENSTKKIFSFCERLFRFWSLFLFFHFSFFISHILGGSLRMF